MKTPVFLLRLMQHAGLSSQAASRLGPEDHDACQFAADLRKLTLDGRVRAVWFHPANELCGTASRLAAATARSMGLHKGVSDYIFLWDKGALAIEFKSRLGRLTSEQADFEQWCALLNIPFILCRSPAEAMETLKAFGILTDA